jgi:two-component system sensor histidine kinase/response regulator
MQKASAFIIILFSAQLAYTQPGSIDSLKTVLNSSQNDTSRVLILNDLSFKYLAYQPRQAKQYAEEALGLSKTLHYRDGEIVALNRLGENEFRQSNYALAVDYVTQSLKLAEQLADSTCMAMAYRVLGNIYTFGFKQYDIALQYQLSALDIYEKKKDKRNIASFYGNITWIYASLNQNLEEAHRLANKGVHLADSLDDKQLLSYNYNSKGLIFMQEGKLDSALKYLDYSIRVAAEINDNAVIAYDKSIMGNVYLQQRNFKKAIDLFDASSIESQKINQREVLKESYHGLAKAYEGLGNYPEAYKNFLLYTQLKDSLVNWVTAQKTLIIKMKFEEEKRDEKITKLELANRQAQQEKMVFGILAAVIFISMVSVIILIVRNNRQRKETTRLLQEKNIEIAQQNKKLQEVNDIKDKFFSIISHDLRSPLSSLKGLLGLVIRNEISENEFKSFAEKLHHLVIGTNETIENLLQWSHSQMVGWNYAPDIIPLHPLVEKCTVLFSEAAKIKNIELTNEVNESELIFAEVNQIELIIRNLIHNALKFTSEGGSIRITANGTTDFVEVCVIDTGMGMSPDQVSHLFQQTETHTTRGTQGERGTGLGLLLCKEMVTNNGGKISVTSEIGKGSVFHIFLKKNSTA